MKYGKMPSPKKTPMASTAAVFQQKSPAPVSAYPGMVAEAMKSARKPTSKRDNRIKK